MRHLILYVATSLDGYLADPQGQVDWLPEPDTLELPESEPSRHDGADQPPESQDTTPDDYLTFYASVDTVLMGMNTYRQITTQLSPDFWPYSEKKTYVFTHTPQEDLENISFTQRSPKEFIRWLNHRKGGDIWLCGGADLIQQCLADDLIHKFHLSIMPIILGQGIPLFPQQETRKNLTLVSTQQKNNILEIVYHRN